MLNENSTSAATLAEILRRLGAGEAPLPEWAAELRRIAAAHPASAVAPAALLRYYPTLLSDDDRRRLQAGVALSSGDITSAAIAIDPEMADLRDFYPPEQPVAGPDTNSTIDLFLRTYGHSSPQEDALLERTIFNPVPEYAETLARDDDPATRTPAPEGSQDALIDAFLAANPADAPVSLTGGPPEPEPVPAPAASGPQTAPKKAPAAPDPDASLSESLAKIFIKQGRYERAYEIISNLSLKNPKKSIYFADQLRFLQKLIIISRASAPSPGSEK